MSQGVYSPRKERRKLVHTFDVYAAALARIEAVIHVRHIRVREIYGLRRIAHGFPGGPHIEVGGVDKVYEVIFAVGTTGDPQEVSDLLERHLPACGPRYYAVLHHIRSPL